MKALVDDAYLGLCVVSLLPQMINDQRQLKSHRMGVFDRQGITGTIGAKIPRAWDFAVCRYAIDS